MQGVCGHNSNNGFLVQADLRTSISIAATTRMVQDYFVASGIFALSGHL
jgi:hypothetical protein